MMAETREDIADTLEELAKDLRTGKPLSGTLLFLEDVIEDVVELTEEEEGE